MNAYFAGETQESPRDRFFYVNDDAELVALRVGDWKFIFKEQRAHQLALWLEPFVELRAPKIVNLRRDPFERALTDSNTYYDWMIDRIYMIVPAQAVVAEADRRSSGSSRRARSRPRSASTACSRSSRRSPAARAEATLRPARGAPHGAPLAGSPRPADPRRAAAPAPAGAARAGTRRRPAPGRAGA